MELELTSSVIKYSGILTAVVKPLHLKTGHGGNVHPMWKLVTTSNQDLFIFSHRNDLLRQHGI